MKTKLLIILATIAGTVLAGLKLKKVKDSYRVRSPIEKTEV